MRLTDSIFAALALCNASLVAAASAWGFQDATVQVQSKADDGGVKLNKEKLDPEKPLSSPVILSSGDSIRVALTTSEDKKAKRPHQAFLTLSEPSSGLEESFPLGVKDSGKGGINLAHKDIPLQLLSSSEPLRASFVIGSFGSTAPLRAHVFDLSLSQDSTTPAKAASSPLRYGKLPEIHHIFRSDPTSPPVFITAVFSCAVFATLPVLLGVWFELGMNLSHFSEAFSTAPVAHGLFIGSVLVLELIFGLYYLRWNLFQTLPPVAVVGTVAFLSGSRALREVQGRRVAGKR